MKVLHINTHLRGGAAKACVRLHEGLLEIGVDSKVLVLENVKTDVPEVYSYVNFYKNPIQKARKKLAARLAGRRRRSKLMTYPKVSDGFYFTDSPFDITQNPLYQEADIIHLHWVNDFLDYPSFFTKNKKPLVWTMHDMSPFSGGNAFEKNFPFEAYEKLIRPQIELKKTWYKNQNMTIVTPSEWMSKKAAQSETLEGITIHPIPYCLNINKFKAVEKDEARTSLRLPYDSTIVLFVADSVSSERKGIDLFLEAMRTLYVNNLLLLVVGNSWEAPEKIPPHRYFGTVQSEEKMSLIYSAADVFVIPSREDNFPNTVLESLCCGTPVVGFEVGGIPEQIEHGKNGALCPVIDPFQLKTTILELLKTDINREAISAEAQKKYANSIQAKRMKTLYDSLL